MPVCYECKKCKFETRDKGNFRRHLDTKKHKKKASVVEKKKVILPSIKPFKCMQCSRTFSQSFRLTKHEEVCVNSKLGQVIKEKDRLIERITNQKDLEIAMLKHDLKHAKQILEVKDESTKQTIDILGSENKFHKKLVEDANKVVKSSMGALKYAMLNYPDAPPLIEYSNMDALQFEKGYSLAEIMIYHDENNTLANKIGDVILEEYKKRDPKEQSFWNTDNARLGYIIVEDDGSGSKWGVDKGGVKVQNMLINPILAHVRAKLNCYSFDNAKLMGTNLHRHEFYSDKICRSNNVIKKIDTGNVCKKVINYITQRVSIADNMTIKNN